MIIDLILDRKDGKKYSAHDFYYDVINYEANDKIAEAMDEGTDQDVKKALCKYIFINNYNLDICKYIKTQRWL